MNAIEPRRLRRALPSDHGLAAARALAARHRLRRQRYGPVSPEKATGWTGSHQTVRTRSRSGLGRIEIELYRERAEVWNPADGCPLIPAVA